MDLASKGCGVPAASEKKRMGRRPRRSLAEKLAAAQARDVVSKLDDDTVVDTELAALYLHMSERQLEDLRRSRGGPTMVKAIESGARRLNQPVRYKMSSLRDFQRMHSAPSTFEAAVKAGIAG